MPYKDLFYIRFVYMSIITIIQTVWISILQDGIRRNIDSSGLLIFVSLFWFSLYFGLDIIYQKFSEGHEDHVSGFVYLSLRYALVFLTVIAVNLLIKRFNETYITTSTAMVWSIATVILFDILCGIIRKPVTRLLETPL
jgi:hypothetical protein